MKFNARLVPGTAKLCNRIKIRFRQRETGSLLNSPFVDPAMTKHADLLLAAGVAGTDTSHAARTNLHKINQLLEHHDSTTFRVEVLLWEVSFEETYEETPGAAA